MAKDNKNYNSDGRSAEDKALDKFAELMIEKLETIQGDWKKPWFTQGVTASIPKNLSGREYNGMNSLMLMMQAEKHGYELPVWCTFDRVTGLNYTKDKQGSRTEAKDDKGNPLPRVGITRGEKSFPVFITVFSVVNPEDKSKIKYDDYKNLPEEERAKYNVYPKLQVYNVFNVQQTNLKEARPELYQKLLDQNNQQTRPTMNEGEMFTFPAIDHMIEHNEWICPIKPTYGDGAYYSISKAEIVVPEKRQFKDGESFYANLAHEMAHSTGAKQYCDRLSVTNYGSALYMKEELTAELTAALISQRYGMEKCIKEDSIPYLKNWLDSLKQEPSFIKTVLQDVKKASQLINQHIEKVQLTLDQEKQANETKSEAQTVDAAPGQTQNVAQEKKEEQKTESKLKEIMTADIPVWAMPYLVNGDPTGMTDKQQAMVDKFIEKNLGGKAFIMDYDIENVKAFNNSPAFGERNPMALPERGESPYAATDTISVRFLENVIQEQTQNTGIGQKSAEQVAAKGTPFKEVTQEDYLKFVEARDKGEDVSQSNEEREQMSFSRRGR